MLCPNCKSDFVPSQINILTKTLLNGKILDCRIRCPLCSKTFDHEGDPEVYRPAVADPRSTIKENPGGRVFGKTQTFLDKTRVDPDWIDYDGVAVNNAARELDYFENLNRGLSESEYNEYRFWQETSKALLIKKEAARLRLIERGEL